jgi:uncharacterized phage protein gp47/JayE
MNIPYSREHADEHTQELIAWYLGLSEETAGRLTDLNPGSNLRDIFEAVAIKLEGLDNAVYTGLRAAIPEILYAWFGVGDGITTFVGFPALPALPAKGYVTFTRNPNTPAPITIPVGTRLGPISGAASANLSFATDVAATITGDTVDVLVTASTAGTASSVQANGLRLIDGVTGVLSATNQAAMNGIPAETDEQRRQRFMVYIRNLARCQCEGLEAGAETAQVVNSGVVVEHVLAARAIEPPDTRGLVDLFIDDGNGTASPALVANTQQIIDGYIDPAGARVIGYKAAGIVVNVKPVVPFVVPVTVAVELDPFFRFADVQPGVQSAVTSYFLSLPIAADVVWTELNAVIATVPGVIDNRLTQPTANVDGAYGGRNILGPLTITQATGLA